MAQTQELLQFGGSEVDLTLDLMEAEFGEDVHLLADSMAETPEMGEQFDRTLYAKTAAYSDIHSGYSC